MEKQILTIDVETTISNKGHWADKTNKLVMVGLKPLGSKPECFTTFDIEYIQNEVDKADIVVGFAIKFDLHWLSNIGINVFDVPQIWDCQIAEFLLEKQRNPYNSLNDACAKYGLPQKLDVVKMEYWDKGIDTDAIPTAVLQSYLELDLFLTEQVFLRQWRQFVDSSLSPYERRQIDDLHGKQE